VTILEMQDVILARGWQFVEHVFNDDCCGLENCFIQLTQDKDPLALTKYPRPTDCIGWGRFRREVAWLKAYHAIVIAREVGKDKQPQ
jgi:hypothetical protein